MHGFYLKIVLEKTLLQFEKIKEIQYIKYKIVFICVHCACVCLLRITTTGL